MSFRLVPSGCKPLTVPNTVKYLEKLKGRDKFLRLVQYFSRFLVFHLLQSDPKNDLGLKLQLLYKAIGTHRKAFRLGMFVDEYLKFTAALENSKDDMKKYLTLALRACMAVFIAHDNVLWLMSIKVLNGDKDGIKQKSYYFRFVAGVLNLILAGMTFAETNEKMQKLSGAVSQDEKNKFEEKQGANVLSIVKNVCDVLTYGSNTKLFPFLSLDDGKMGLLGSISAVAGGFPDWLKL